LMDGGAPPGVWSPHIGGLAAVPPVGVHGAEPPLGVRERSRAELYSVNETRVKNAGVTSHKEYFRSVS